MSKTITVKGVGKVSASPDLVVLSMVLESQDLIYEKAFSFDSEGNKQAQNHEITVNRITPNVRI